MAIATGTSYTEAARKARGGYWGPGGKGQRRATSVEGGQTVAEWLHQFTWVIAEPWVEMAWPECVVLDSTEFNHFNPETQRTEQLFVVLAAWGYPARDSYGRLWRLEARPRDRGSDWCEFLGALPGRSRSVVCDRDLAIIDGVQKRWGEGPDGVPVHLCEHHLWENGLAALDRDGLAEFAGPLPTLLNDAFRSPSGWEAFVGAVESEPTTVEARQWARFWDQDLLAQTKRRAELPAHYSTGALEPKPQDVRAMLERRKWTFRNRDRMNLLLELVRLRLNRHDDPIKWAALIRAHIRPHRSERRPIRLGPVHGRPSRPGRERGPGLHAASLTVLPSLAGPGRDGGSRPRRADAPGGSRSRRRLGRGKNGGSIVA